MTPQEHRNAYINRLLVLPRPEALAEVRQFLIDAMDILEQSDEELPVIAACKAFEEVQQDQLLKRRSISP